MNFKQALETSGEKKSGSWEQTYFNLKSLCCFSWNVPLHRPSPLPVRSLEAEDFRHSISWGCHSYWRFPNKRKIAERKKELIERSSLCACVEAEKPTFQKGCTKYTNPLWRPKDTNEHWTLDLLVFTHSKIYGCSNKARVCKQRAKCTPVCIWGPFKCYCQLAPVDREVKDLCSMATVLWHHVAGAGVPQPQCSIQAAGGHHRRRILPLQVDDAGLRATQMHGDGFRWLESLNSLD